jgi:thiol-disulfide isomerase/thioredoxin
MDAGMRRRCRGFWFDMTGVWVLLVVLAIATAFGIWFQRTSGRITDRKVPMSTPGVVPANDDDPPVDIEPDEPSAQSAALAAALDGRLGDRATMVQFSSAFCQPCRATRRILEEVTVLVPGVSHVEIDAEDNLELVRTLDIRRTPTVLFLDADGVVRKHASGQPRKADVIAALGELMPGTPGAGTPPDFAI